MTGTIAEQIVLQIQAAVSGQQQVAGLTVNVNNLSLAAERLDGRFRDANGRLREANGRFVAAGDAAQGMAGQMAATAGGVGKLHLGLLNLNAGLQVVQQVTQAVTQTLGTMRAWADEANRAATATQVFEMTIRRFGLSTEEANGTAERLAKRFGLSVQEVQDSMTTLIRAGFRDMGQLEQVMTGAAASSIAFGRTAAEGFDRVADAATTGLSAALNSIGIAENIGPMLDRYAKSVGKTADALTDQERAQVLANLVTKATSTEVEALDTILNDYVRSQQAADLAATKLHQNLGRLFMPIIAQVNTALAQGTGALLDLTTALQTGKDPLDALALRFPQLATALVRIRPAVETVQGVLSSLRRTADEVWNGTLRPALERFAPQVERMGAVVGPALARLGVVFRDVAGIAREAFERVVVPLFEAVAPVVMHAVERAAPILASLGEAFRDLFALLVEIWERYGVPLFERLAPVVKTAIDTAAGVLTPLVDSFKAVIALVKAAIEGDWSRVWDKLKDAVGNALLAVQGVFEGGFHLGEKILKFGQDLATQFMNGFANVALGIERAIADGLENAISKINPKVLAALKALGIDLQGVPDALRTDADRARGSGAIDADRLGPQPGQPLPGYTSAQALFRAIAGQETGGLKNPYGTVNGIGALGKYQIMTQHLLLNDDEYNSANNTRAYYNRNQGNVGRLGHGWDYAALGRDVTPAEFLKNPAIQDAIAQAQMAANLQKRLSEAGNDLEKAVKEAAKDWYGRGKPGAGMPTPDEYAASVWARFQRVQANPAQNSGAYGGGTRAFTYDDLGPVKSPNGPIQVATNAVASEWGAAFITSLKDQFLDENRINSDCAIVAARVMGRLGVHLEGAANERINAGKLAAQVVASGAKKVEGGEAQARSGDFVHFQGPGFGAKGSRNHVGVIVGVTADGAVVLQNPGDGPTEVVSLKSVLASGGRGATATIYRPKESPYASGSQAATQGIQAAISATDRLADTLTRASAVYGKVSKDSKDYAGALKVYQAALQAVNAEAQKALKNPDLSKEDRQAYTGLALRAKGMLADLAKGNDPVEALNKRLEVTRTNLNLATEGTAAYTKAQQAHRAALLAVIDASTKQAAGLKADDPKRKMLGDSVKSARSELKALDDAIAKGDGAAEAFRQRQEEILQGTADTAARTAAAAQRGYDKAVTAAGQSGEKQLAVVRQQGAALLLAQQGQVKAAYDLAVQQADDQYKAAMAGAAKLAPAARKIEEDRAAEAHRNALARAATAREDGLREAQAAQNARLIAAKQGKANDTQALVALQKEQNLAILREQQRGAEVQAAALQRQHDAALTRAGDNARSRVQVENTLGVQLRNAQVAAAAAARRVTEAEADETYRQAMQAASKLYGDRRRQAEQNAATAKQNAYNAARDTYLAAEQGANTALEQGRSGAKKTLEQRQQEQLTQTRQYEAQLRGVTLAGLNQRLTDATQARDRALADLKNDAAARLEVEQGAGAQLVALQNRQAEAQRNADAAAAREEARTARLRNAQTYAGDPAGLKAANQAVDAVLNGKLQTIQATYYSNLARFSGEARQRLEAAAQAVTDAEDKAAGDLLAGREKAVQSLTDAAEKLFSSGTNYEEQARNRAAAIDSVAASMRDLLGVTGDQASVADLEDLPGLIDRLTASGMDLSEVDFTSLQTLGDLLGGLATRNRDFLPVDQAKVFLETLQQIGVSAQEVLPLLDGGTYSGKDRDLFFNANAAFAGNDRSTLEQIGRQLEGMDLDQLPALKTLRDRIERYMLDGVKAGLAAVTQRGLDELQGQVAALEREKDSLDPQEYLTRHQKLLEDVENANWAAEEERLRNEGRTDEEIETARLQHERRLTGLHAQGIADQFALDERARARTVAAQRQADDARAAILKSNLDRQHQLGLISETDYIEAVYQAQRAAAQRAQDRAVQDATTRTVNPNTGAVTTTVDLAAVRAANDARTAADVDAQNQRDIALTALRLRNARALEDAVTRVEDQARDEQHRKGLISDVDYQRQQEAAQVAAAQTRYARAVQDAHGETDAIRAANLTLQADLTAITAQGEQDRAAIREKAVNAEIAAAQGRLKRSYGLDGQQELVAALEKAVQEASDKLTGMGPAAAGTAEFNTQLEHLLDLQDQLADAKALPRTLGAWQSAITQLGDDFAKGKVSGEQLTDTLKQITPQLLAAADAAEKAGDAKTAQAFRDLAGSLHAMSPEVAALLVKFGKFQQYLQYVVDIAGAFGKLAGAMGEAEQEYDSLTGAKLQTPWKDLQANLDGAANAAQKLMALAGDVMRIIANPADIGAWVGAITKVVSGIAEALGGFKKAKAEAQRLRDEFAQANPLLNAQDYQKVSIRSRGFFADWFGGGPQVVAEVDRLGLPIAQSIASHISTGIGNGFDAYLQSGNIEDFSKALNAELTKGLKDSMVQGFLNDPARKNDYASAIKAYTDAWKTHDPAQIQAAAAGLYAQTQATTEAAKELAAQLDELDRINGTGRYSPEAIAARERDLAGQRLTIAEQTNELLHTQGLKSDADYEAEKLRLALERIRLEMEAALAAEGLTAEQIALIRQQYDLQAQQAQATFDAEARRRAEQQAKDLRDLTLNNAETALGIEERLAAASAGTEEEKWQVQQVYARRRLELTLRRLDAEEAAELASAELTAEMREAIAAKYDLARQSAQAQLTAAQMEHDRQVAAQARQQAEQTAQSWRQSLMGGVQALLNGESPLEALYKGVRDRIAQAIQEGFIAKRILSQLDPIFAQLDAAIAQGLDPSNLIRQIAGLLPQLGVQVTTELGPLVALLNSVLPNALNSNTAALNGNTQALNAAQFQQTTIYDFGRGAPDPPNLRARLAGLY